MWCLILRSGTATLLVEASSLLHARMVSAHLFFACSTVPRRPSKRFDAAVYCFVAGSPCTAPTNCTEVQLGAAEAKLHRRVLNAPQGPIWPAWPQSRSCAVTAGFAPGASKFESDLPG
jgi:hypothetical protein